MGHGSHHCLRQNTHMINLWLLASKKNSSREAPPSNVALWCSRPQRAQCSRPEGYQPETRSLGTRQCAPANVRELAVFIGSVNGRRGVLLRLTSKLTKCGVRLGIVQPVQVVFAFLEDLVVHLVDCSLIPEQITRRSNKPMYEEQATSPTCNNRFLRISFCRIPQLTV